MRVLSSMSFDPWIREKSINHMYDCGKYSKLGQITKQKEGAQCTKYFEKLIDW